MPFRPGPPADNPLTRLVLEQRVSVSGTVVLPKDVLVEENHELAERARILLAPGPDSASPARDEITAGMTISAAVPVFEGSNFLGVIYGGILLNRGEAFVDTVRDTVFQGESFRGKGIGTATIFFNDVRIATNVLTPEGRRALGTRVSPEVEEHVLGKGRRWTARAFVFNDWYITAYSPIETISGRRAGMLYVGVLEEKYADIRRDLLTVYILLTAAVMLAASALGWVIASRISSPIQRLINASRQVSEGNLTPDIGPTEKGEIGAAAEHLQRNGGVREPTARRQRGAHHPQPAAGERRPSGGRGRPRDQQPAHRRADLHPHAAAAVRSGRGRAHRPADHRRGDRARAQDRQGPAGLLAPDEARP